MTNQKTLEYKIVDLWDLNNKYYDQKGKVSSPDTLLGSSHQMTLKVSTGDEKVSPVGHKEEPLLKTLEEKPISESEDSRDIAAVIDTFKGINPAQPKWFGRPVQREAAARMIKTHGLGRVMKIIELLPQTNTIPYLPTITTPAQLEDKWAALEAGIVKKRNEIKSKQREYVI